MARMKKDEETRQKIKELVFEITNAMQPFRDKTRYINLTAKALNEKGIKTLTGLDWDNNNLSQFITSHSPDLRRPIEAMPDPNRAKKPEASPVPDTAENQSDHANRLAVAKRVLEIHHSLPWHRRLNALAKEEGKDGLPPWSENQWKAFWDVYMVESQNSTKGLADSAVDMVDKIVSNEPTEILKSSAGHATVDNLVNVETVPYAKPSEIPLEIQQYLTAMEDRLTRQIQENIRPEGAVLPAVIDDTEDPPKPGKDGKKFHGEKGDIRARIDINLLKLFEADVQRYGGNASRCMDAILWRYYRKPKLSYEE